MKNNELLKKYAGISTRDDAIYEVLIMPSRDGNPITRKQKSSINLRYQTNLLEQLKNN